MTTISGFSFGLSPVAAVETVQQLSVSFDSTIVLSGSTHASLSSDRLFSAVWNTSTVILIDLPFPRSPVHSTRLIGFSEVVQPKFGSAVTASGMSPIGRKSTTLTPKASSPAPPTSSLVTFSSYFETSLCDDSVGPVLVIFRLMTDLPVVVAVSVLLVSSPSGMALSGSTNAWLKSVVLAFGALNLTSIVRVDGTPGRIVPSVPAIVPP